MKTVFQFLFSFLNLGSTSVCKLIFLNIINSLPSIPILCTGIHYFWYIIYNLIYLQKILFIVKIKFIHFVTSVSCISDVNVISSHTILLFTTSFFNFTKNMVVQLQCDVFFFFLGGGGYWRLLCSCHFFFFFCSTVRRAPCKI